MRTVLGLWGSLPGKSVSPLSDEEALASNWKAVGDDLREATIELSQDDQQLLVRTLQDPPKANKALVDLVEQFR